VHLFFLKSSEHDINKQKPRLSCKKRTKADVFISDVQVKNIKEKKPIFRYFNNKHRREKHI